MSSDGMDGKGLGSVILKLSYAISFYPPMNPLQSVYYEYRKISYRF